jgi:DNA modification methylase
MVLDRVINDSWDFATANTKEYTHCFHAYPAMMIPQIARKLIEDYKTADTELVFDPYCGSGTTLVEAKLKGIASVGTDLNPMARLVARTKSSTYDVAILKETKMFFVSKLLINYDKSIEVELPTFFNIDYWFSQDVINKLAYIKYLIFTEIDPSVRDFFLVPFSETVREASYTRNGEFKLFRMEQTKVDIFNVNTFELFIRKVERNFKGYLEFHKDANPCITSDVYDFNTCTDIPDGILDKGVDLIVTSPPYGDSFTTVAYGSFSKLSNQWLNIEEAGQIDKILMGGTKRQFDIPTIHSAELELIQLKANDVKRYQEVMLFLFEYQQSINNVSKVVKENGIVCYVVGNRRVKDVQIPLDYITAEFFENNGFEHLNTFVRRIPNKRMPSKNSPTNKTGELASTMVNEYIVVMQKVEK